MKETKPHEEVRSAGLAAIEALEKGIKEGSAEIARHQLETCKFAVHQGTSEMFGEIDDCTALVKPFCKLEGKPCAFYKAEDKQ